MYGSELLIENRSDRAKSYFVRRREREPQPSKAFMPDRVVCRGILLEITSNSK